MWGLAPVNGQFRSLSAGGTVSPTGEITGRFAMATASVDTKSAKRDDELRGADFFLSEKYPEIVFSLESLATADQDVTLSGTLAVRDTRRRISFPAKAVLSGDGQLAIDAEVEVDRSEYGMTVNHLRMVKMECSVTLHAVFTKS
jgi:polyisoprenoid-binding protein YceI